MIRYVKCGLDEIVLSLFNKLEGTGYVKRLVHEYENQRFSIRKVYDNTDLKGLILFRGLPLLNGQTAFEILHYISARADINFGEIVHSTIKDFVSRETFAAGTKFDKIFFHVNTKGLIRLSRKFWGEPDECIYKIDLSENYVQTRSNR